MDFLLALRWRFEAFVPVPFMPVRQTHGFLRRRAQHLLSIAQDADVGVQLRSSTYQRIYISTIFNIVKGVMSQLMGIIP